MEKKRIEVELRRKTFTNEIKKKEKRNSSISAVFVSIVKKIKIKFFPSMRSQEWEDEENTVNK